MEEEPGAERAAHPVEGNGQMQGMEEEEGDWGEGQGGTRKEGEGEGWRRERTSAAVQWR